MGSPIRPGMQLRSGLTLVRALRRGGMGEVWIGDSDEWGQVAVKFLSAGQSHVPAAVQRFEREWLVASTIDSPHVVRMLEHGRFEERRPYIVMELLEGDTLQELIDSVTALPAAAAIVLLRQVADALDAAHAEGIVHRDVKPENIVLARAGTGEELVVKVLDFGLAKPWLGGHTLTATGVLMGTPYYMSPEQLVDGGKNVDHRADLWALAAVAYRILFGCHPFDGANLHQLVFEIVGGSHQSLESVGGPHSLEPWFERAFHKDSGKRFASAGEMIDRLEELLLGAVSHRRGTEDTTTQLVFFDPSPSEERIELGDTQRMLETRSDTLTDPFYALPHAPDSVTRVHDALAAPGPPELPVHELEPETLRADTPLPPEPPASETPETQAPDTWAPATRPMAPSARPSSPASIEAPTVPLPQGQRGGGRMWLPLLGLLVIAGAFAAWITLRSGPPTPTAEPPASPPSLEPSGGDAPEAAIDATSAASSQPAPSTSTTSPAAPGPEMATLDVQCAPACIVLIDGIKVGISPVQRELEPGSYLVTAYRDDVGATTARVELAPGQQLTHRVSMRR